LCFVNLTEEKYEDEINSSNGFFMTSDFGNETFLSSLFNKILTWADDNNSIISFENFKKENLS